MGQLFQELKRRNVIRVAIAYAVVTWLLIQVADTVFPILGLPRWAVTLVTALLIIGFPVALVFAWAFELTPEGIKLEKHVVREESITKVTGRKLDFIIIALLVLGSGYLAYDKFVLDPSRDAELIQATTEAVTEQVIESAISENTDKSIAVLAFADLSPEGDQEYFADGISEEILNLLARIPELRVTSRSSAFSFKGQNLDVPTIGTRLKVAHILEGSVRKDGDQLRVTAQLIDAQSDSHLWSETYNRKLEDIFAVQDEIAAAVVNAMKIKLLGEEPKATKTELQAYALYLQGRHFNNQFTAESNNKAETLLKEALEIDPGSAPAWTELGIMYHYSADPFGFRTFKDGYELARYAAQRALDLDPQYGRAYAVLAWVNYDYSWDFDAAFQNLQQALALHPGDAGILWIAGALNRGWGRLDEAIKLQRQSIAIDPLQPDPYYRLGRTLYEAHSLDEAADSFEMALSLGPDWLGGHYRLGRVRLAQGDASAALVEMEQEPYEAYRLTGMAIVQHALEDRAASDAALHELIKCCAAEAGFQVAEIYAFRGEVDKAFEWLENAYDNRDTGMNGTLVNPLFVNLHNDPRWEPLLDKIGLPH